MAVNTELARKVYNKVNLDRKAHDQALYGDGLAQTPDGHPCGTVMCAAGWAAAYDGRCIIDEYGLIDVPNGDWDGEGRDALGLSDRLATYLFHRCNNEEAREVLRLLAEGGGSEDPAREWLGLPPVFRL